MRAAVRLAWRAAGIAAFGATAAIAVILSSHTTMKASLTSASDTGGGHARAVAVGRCTDAAIDIWLGVGPAGPAGRDRVDLEFTNISRSACKLRGYPGVVDASAGQASKPAGRSAATVSAVIVKPGQTAHAVADLGPGGCRGAGGLRVGLPADRGTPYTLPMCSAPLRVGPVEPGMGIPGM